MTALAKTDATDAEIVRPDDAPDPPALSGTGDPLMGLIADLARSGQMDTLDRIMAMRDKLKAEQAEEAYARAFAAAKAEFGEITKNRRVFFESKDKTKPNTDYRHESLSEVERAVVPALARYGITHSYDVKQDMEKGGLITVTCTLRHVDGHRERLSLTAGRDEGPGRNNLQAVASTITYLKRYSLMAITGTSSEHDPSEDDGRTGGGVTEPDPISEEQFRELRDLMDRSGADEAKFLGFLRVGHLHDLPAARFEEARAALQSKIKAAK